MSRAVTCGREEEEAGIVVAVVIVAANLIHHLKPLAHVLLEDIDHEILAPLLPRVILRFLQGTTIQEREPLFLGQDLDLSVRGLGVNA